MRICYCLNGKMHTVADILTFMMTNLMLNWFEHENRVFFYLLFILKRYILNKYHKHDF